MGNFNKNGSGWPACKPSLCLIFILSVFILSRKPAFAQQVGVNYNGQFDHVDITDLGRTNTTWVRGFIDFFEFYSNPSKLDTDPRIQKYLTLKNNGFNTILNIKWNYKGKDFPAVNSTEMNNIKAFLETIYDKVWAKTDIIVVGNEPFIESDADERTANGPLVKFYRQMCIKTKNYRVGKKNNPIYVGSFDNLYISSKRIQAVKDLLAFAKNHDWMAGIDLHIHHSDINQINSVFDWVVNQIRSNQQILVTEYSLMKHWRSKMSNTINGTFANKYGYNTGWKNYQYVDFALKNPRPRAEWVDYFKMHAWYNNRARYIKNSFDRFKSYGKFHIATYAMRQSFPFNKDFTANTDPWVLNPLYVNRTVVKNPTTGRFQFNYAFIDDFRAIQSGSSAAAHATSKNSAVEKGVKNIRFDHGNAEIFVFPNPASDFIRVSNRAAGVKVFIRDITGKLLASFAQDQISLSGLGPGLYFLSLSDRQQTYKLIIQ